MKEGSLTFPFVWLTISRPRKVVVKYTDEKGDLQEGHLDGMISRIFQHEYDHMLGRTFTEYASKMKLDMAYKKAEKEMDKVKRYTKCPKEKIEKKYTKEILIQVLLDGVIQMSHQINLVGQLWKNIE